jgi:tetratricopeptide (TPR) repeat protein
MLSRTKTIGLFICVALWVAGVGVTKAQTLQDAIRFTQSEQFENANKAFQSLISQQPQNGANYFYYGDYYIRKYLADTVSVNIKKATGDAAKTFDKGTSVDANNPLNFIGLAESALFLKNTAKAQEYIAKAKALLPSKQNKIKMPKDEQATAYVKIAEAYVMSLSNDTALIFSSLRQAEKLNPKDINIYLVEGDAYFYLLNDGSNAIKNYNQASKIDPKSPAAQLRIGRLWVRSKNYADGLTAYKLVVQLDATYAPAYKELGFLNAQLGNANDAKQNFQKFLELSSGNTDAQMQYINTLFELKDFPEVAKQAQNALTTNTNNVDLYRALAYANYETGKYTEAKEALETFLKKASDENIRPSDYAYLGRSYAKLKQDTIAGNFLMKAYSLDSVRVEYLSEAAVSFTTAKAYPKAIDAYKKKLATPFKTIQDYYFLGTAYYSTQQFTKADSTFTTLIEKVPSYIGGYLWKARSLSMTDPDSKTGAALGAYQTLLEKTQAEPDKNKVERKEAFSYMNYYYFVQFNATKSHELGRKAIECGNKVLEIDPNDTNAKKINEAIDRIMNRPAQPKK